MFKNYILPSLMVILCACQGQISSHHHNHNEDSHQQNTDGETMIQPKIAESLGIKTVPIKIEPFYGIIRTNGKIEVAESDNWNITADYSGVVQILQPINIGSTVNASQFLFKIRSAELNKNNIESDIELCKTELMRAKDQYERIEKLHKERLATTRDLIEARKDLIAAQSNYNRLHNVFKDDIAAPHSGYITAIYVKNGQYVEEGETLATISTGKDLVIEAYFPAKYANILHKIIGANFKTNYSDVIYTANECISTTDIIEGSGSVIPIHFKANKFDGLSAGMPIEVYIKTSDNHNAMVVPIEAITEQYGKYYIYIHPDEDCYIKREVTLIQTDGKYYQIEPKDEIHEGDEVVVSGTYYVKMAGQSSSIPHGHSH